MVFRRAVAVIIASIALVMGPLFLAPAAQAGAPPTDPVPPRISGQAIVGSTLSVSTGGWTGSPPFFYRFQWRDSKNSDLSDVQTYTPTADDIGQVLTARVTVQDGNNDSAYRDVSTSPVVESDIMNTVPPKFSAGLAVGDTVTVTHGTFTSGSGALSYSYAWSSTDGQASKPLSDTGSSHVITKADLGLSLSATVTASSATEHVSVIAQTPSVVIPAVPFASDAGLTAANRGTLAVSVSGTSATITDSAGTSGDGAFVYAYSQPTSLGWSALGADKKFTVSIDKLATGSHKLVVINQAGEVVGWVAVTRAADPGSLAAAFGNPIALVAGAIILLGIVVVIVTAITRRRHAPRH